MAADFEGVHHLMSEALQVDTQNLRGEGRCQSRWAAREDDREAHREANTQAQACGSAWNPSHTSETYAWELTAPPSHKGWLPVGWLPEGPAASDSAPACHAYFPRILTLAWTLSLLQLQDTVPTTAILLTWGPQQVPERRRNSSSGTPAMMDPSVNCLWGLSGKFHGLL